MAYHGSSSNLRREIEAVKYDDWDGSTFIDAGLVLNPNNGRLDLAGSQKDLTWLNQEYLNQSYQTSQNQWNYQPQVGLASTEAGTSDSGRKLGSKKPLVAHPLRNSGKTQIFNEKKKEIDKRYREKCRESKKLMECELDKLGRENKNLNDENTNLMMEKQSINKSLQSAVTETKQLNTEIHNLRSNMTNQQIFVDSFLKKLDDVSNNENHQLEIKKLQNEIILLKQSNWDDWVMNKGQLVQEIADLEHENKVLKVQVEALCEKIHNHLEAGDTKACKIATDSNDLWAGCSARYQGLD